MTAQRHEKIVAAAFAAEADDAAPSAIIASGTAREENDLRAEAGDAAFQEGAQGGLDGGMGQGPSVGGRPGAGEVVFQVILDEPVEGVPGRVARAVTRSARGEGRRSGVPGSTLQLRVLY